MSRWSGLAPAVNAQDAYTSRRRPKFNRVTACWPWAGRHEEGRPVIRVGPPNRRSKRFVYTVIYEELVGPIPEGMIPHHVCENPWCCNPAHIQPMTRADHNREHDSLGEHTKPGPRKTHCANGHEYTPENTYIDPKRPAARSCRICKREADRRRKERRRG